jgi:hypothetical protein
VPNGSNHGHRQRISGRFQHVQHRLARIFQHGLGSGDVRVPSLGRHEMETAVCQHSSFVSGRTNGVEQRAIAYLVGASFTWFCAGRGIFRRHQHGPNDPHSGWVLERFLGAVVFGHAGHNSNVHLRSRSCATQIFEALGFRCEAQALRQPALGTDLALHMVP